MNERPTIDDVPKFGVPERISRREVSFVVVAGLPLTFFCFYAAGVIFDTLGLSPLEDTSASVPIVLAAIGVGPALAYHLQRALRASGISRGIGCLALAGWSALVLLVAGYGGPVAGLIAGIVVLGAAAAYLVRRIGRPGRVA